MVPDYATIRLEVELEPELEHPRRHDLLDAVEVRGSRNTGRVEGGLIREAARHRSVGALARARIERVVEFRNDRGAAPPVDREALVRAQRQQTERVRAIRAARLHPQIRRAL